MFERTDECKDVKEYQRGYTYVLATSSLPPFLH